MACRSSLAGTPSSPLGASANSAVGTRDDYAPISQPRTEILSKSMFTRVVGVWDLMKTILNQRPLVIAFICERDYLGYLSDRPGTYDVYAMQGTHLDHKIRLM
jgi:hypothetical protein